MRELTRETEDGPNERPDHGDNGVADEPADSESPSALRDRINRQSDDDSAPPADVGRPRRDESERVGTRPHDKRPVDMIRPLSDAEWTEHVVEVRTRLDKARADGLATDHQHTTDPDRSRWTRDRRLIHREIIDDLYDAASGIPNEGKAIIAGGLAGAGKTTVLESHAGIDRSQYLTINPDVIKEELAKRGLVPAIDGLSPMEASDLVHEESSYVARQLASRAQSDGKNIIWDITMSSRAKTESRIDDLRASGYDSVEGIFVDIPVEVSAARAEYRHRQDHDKYIAGDGLGGRHVPPEIIFAQADPDWGSKNRHTFEELKSSFDRWSIFDNGVDGRDPFLSDSGMYQTLRRDLDDH